MALALWKESSYSKTGVHIVGTLTTLHIAAPFPDPQCLGMGLQ